MTVGERIKYRRKQIGISAEELAERISKSPATVYRYERGDIAKVDSEILLPIATALFTTPAFLMGWESGNDNSAATFLSTKEFELIESYRAMNQEGKEKLHSYLDDLIQSGKYIKSDESELVQAE